uniref:C-type LECtin n=1 Tax=Caenorhabditis japonica TaxID=281687 RepID=A0A8R1HMN0_CAEJA
MRLISFSILLTVFAKNVLGGSVVCPSGFSVLNNNKCIRLFTNELPHRQAEVDCRFLGGTLVNVKNAIDNRGITNIAATAGVNSIWIGTYCFDVNNGTNCYFDDKSGQLSYSNFAAGFPRVYEPYGGCTYLVTTGQYVGQWYNSKCDIAGMAFVCEAPISYFDQSYCSHNYNGYCYYPSTELQLTTINTTYTRAQSLCQSKNSNLVSIHSMRELDYVQSLYRSSQTNSIVLGATALLPNTFDWADNSAWNFSYMDPFSNSNGDCLQMNLTTRLWTAIDCQANNYFLCKRPVSSQSVDQNQNDEIKFIDDPDFSQCNTTFFMAPGVITSFGYPQAGLPSTYCTWRLVTLGSYQIGLFFTHLQTFNDVVVYDEYSNPIGNAHNRSMMIAPSNIAIVSFKSGGYNAYTGFSATVLPY